MAERARQLADVGGVDTSLVRTRAPLIAALRQRRMDLGISQDALAMSIGCSIYLVRWWELGLRVPSTFMAQCWAEALGCRLVLLLVDGDPPGGVSSEAQARGGGQKRRSRATLDPGGYFSPSWADR